MKRVKNRAVAVLLLAALTVLGLCVFTVRLATNGRAWASYAAAQSSGGQGSGGQSGGGQSGAGQSSGGQSGGGQSGAGQGSAGARSATGTLTDRNGLVLASVDDNGKRVFAESTELRKAALHVTGDRAGNIGTGALTMFAADLTGYNFFTGAYSRDWAGKTVELTIDAGLNAEAYKALDGRRGAVMVMNYITGEILCMVSSPTFDPENPPAGVDTDPSYEGAYLNRAISAAYTPGSTFKLLTAAAAIESIPDVNDRVFTCDGTLETSHGTVKCSGVHGAITFKDAFAVSCNSAFGELALELGADKLEEYAEKYGLTGQTSISGIKTVKGNFDAAEPDTADLAWSGVGQYGDLLCPAAVLRFAGAIANEGVAATMKLKTGGAAGIFSGGGERIIKKETARKLSEMMAYNVTKTYGAGNYPGLELHAKTGTAEVGPDSKPHAWFSGFITNEGFPLAFVVVVENGGSGAMAAGPVANRVLQRAIAAP